jgi:hypothetical protein
MKKMNKTAVIAVLAGLLISSAALAQSGAVYSLNVVGFQKVNVQPSGLTLPGIPFEPDSAELNDVIGDQLTGAKNSAGADRIYIWDASTQEYKKYFLKSTLGNQWVSYDDTLNPTTNAFLDVSDGFWIDASSSSSQEVILVGDVLNVDAVTNDVVNGLNMISYPFSTPKAINDLGLDTGTSAKNSAGADKIFAWDMASQQYVKFFFRSTLGDQWVSYDQTDTPATNIIDPSQGLWYDAINPFTWVATRPYTLD